MLVRSALLLGARYVYPWLRRKVVRGVKGFLSSGTFAGKKNLDIFSPANMSNAPNLTAYVSQNAAGSGWYKGTKSGGFYSRKTFSRKG